MRSLRSAEVMIALGVLACFILLGWLDARRTERAAESFDTYSSYDFQHGGYHAWYDLLRREGIRAVHSTRRPAYIDDSVSTLIVANNLFDAMARKQVGKQAGVYSSGDLEGLRKWVVSGGRLVWLVDQSMAANVPLLLGAGANPQEADLRLPYVSQSGKSSDHAVSLMPSALTSGVFAVSGTSPLRIPFDSSPHMTPVVADKSGSVVAWYPLGKGSIVVVTDETLFENGRLGHADNARLAYNLAAFNLKPGQMVAFEEWAHGYQTGDTWWTILPRTFQAAIVITGGALLLLLLGSLWRFGPAAQLPDNSERTSEEYVSSMAALLERGGAQRAAVRDLSQIALHAAARSVGMPDSSPASAIAARLQGGNDGDTRAHDLVTLERLAGYEHPSDAELIQAATLSRSLRKDLSFDASHAVQPRRHTSRRSA